MTTIQIPPADELFDIRTRIKALEERGEALRALMMSDASARSGNNYVAEVKTVTTSRTDLKELRANHPSLVAEYTFSVTEKRIELRGINEDGEIVSLRRKKE